jgi:hypothetical protein
MNIGANLFATRIHRHDVVGPHTTMSSVSTRSKRNAPIIALQIRHHYRLFM